MVKANQALPCMNMQTQTGKTENRLKRLGIGNPHILDTFIFSNASCDEGQQHSIQNQHLKFSTEILTA